MIIFSIIFSSVVFRNIILIQLYTIIAICVMQ